jgi:hypothetical protein
MNLSILNIVADFSVEEQQGMPQRLMLPTRKNPKIPTKRNKAKNLGLRLSEKRLV